MELFVINGLEDEVRETLLFKNSLFSYRDDKSTEKMITYKPLLTQRAMKLLGAFLHKSVPRIADGILQRRLTEYVIPDFESNCEALWHVLSPTNAGDSPHESPGGWKPQRQYHWDPTTCIPTWI